LRVRAYHSKDGRLFINFGKNVAMKIQVGDKVKEIGGGETIYTVKELREGEEALLEDHAGKLDVMKLDALHGLNKQPLNLAYKSAKELE
jgi:hypothetical protein